MKLKTLIEFQLCYDLLRASEEATNNLSGKQYVECLRSKSLFDAELALHMNKLPAVEVTGEAS